MWSAICSFVAGITKAEMRRLIVESMTDPEAAEDDPSVYGEECHSVAQSSGSTERCQPPADFACSGDPAGRGRGAPQERRGVDARSTACPRRVLLAPRDGLGGITARPADDAAVSA